MTDRQTEFAFKVDPLLLPKHVSQKITCLNLYLVDIGQLNRNALQKIGMLPDRGQYRAECQIGGSRSIEENPGT